MGRSLCSVISPIPSNNLFQISVYYCKRVFRFSSGLSRASAELDDVLSKKLEDQTIKPKKHPGIFSHSPVSLPHNVKSSVQTLLKEGPKKQLLTEARDFDKYLKSRQIPIEKSDFLNKKTTITSDTEKSINVNLEELNEDELKRFNTIMNGKVNKILKQRVYHWQRIDFTKYMSLLYLVTRGAAEYAAIHQIFKEINTRSAFTPKSIFDFGSGVGSVVWAANSIWGDSISEYYCIDSSSHAIDISESIMKDYQNTKLIKGLYYRQFLPSSNDISSDVVVSAYSLLELPSALSRLETVLNLWNRTTSYLVLIERGTKAGFNVINEAKEYILSTSQRKASNTVESHVFAPCPHDLLCPRLTRMDETCYFQAPYFCFPQIPESVQKESYSYVVLKKGPRNKDNKQWPRIVQPVLTKSRHVICRLCTQEGKLNEVIFTPAKHGKTTYRCAKASSWGDLLPCSIKPSEEVRTTDVSLEEEAPT